MTNEAVVSNSAYNKQLARRLPDGTPSAPEERARIAEAALEESEERLRLAAEATGFGIFDYVPDTGSLRWDARVRELFGIRPNDPVTYEGSFLAGLHPADREMVDAAVRAALDPSGSGVFDIEYRTISPIDGQERWIAARGRLIVDKDRSRRFVGTVQDVTEQRRAVEALASSEDRYRSLFEKMDEGFCIIQFLDGPHGPLSDYMHIEANPACERQLGIANLVGRTLRDIASHEANGWLDIYGKVLRTGEPASFEREFVANDRILEVAAHRIEPATRRQVAVLFRDITARKQAEATLRASEAVARQAVERAQLALAAGAIIGTWHWDLLTDRFTVDDAFSQSFGLDPTLGRENIPLARIVATVHPDDQAGLSEAISAAIERGGPYAHQYRTRRADGNYYWLEANGRVNHGEDGTPLSFPGVLIDLQDRRALAEERDRALTELRASEADLRLVTDNLPFLISFVDSSLTFRFANAAYQGWYNLSPESVVGRTISEIAGAEGYEVRRPAIERALTGESVKFDLEWPWPDGRRRVADIRYLPRRDANDNVDGFYIFVQDVTELREAATLLSDRADILTQEVAERTADRDRIWDVSRDLLLVSDLNGVWLNINPAWIECLGWGREELLGRSSEWLEHPDDQAMTRAEVGRLAQGQTTFAFENRFRHRDGSYRDLSWTAVSADGRIYATARDVTEARAQAAALAITEEALRQSQKMEAVGQLTGGLAHDFNNLLAGISGSLELMSARISQGRLKDVEKYLVAAQGASKRAAALTHRLLAFSRRQTLTPKATNVNALVGGMLELIQRTVGPSIQIETVYMAGLWPALVDPSQLENALLNLCINARDAMPDGGKMTIETGNRWIDRYGGKQHDMPEGQYLSLCISDTGTGMSPDVVAKAFDPFFTTKPIGQGTGLGLSMIYGFARQSGGQARIYSELGRGTMVCIYLPRYRGEAESDETFTDNNVLSAAGDTATVLVVDDEPTVRMLITDVLNDLGYTAIEAVDGVGGLKVLQSDSRIDLLVTDVGLPGMNGRHMADAARVTRPALKVLFITGFAENALLNHGHLEPGMDVLTKPFAVENLAARIRELIAR